VLPLLELFDRNLLLQSEEPIQRCERPGFAFVGLFERLELPYRRVLWIARRDIVVTSLGAHAAMYAGVEIGRCSRAEVFGEIRHGLLHALVVAHVALFVESRFRLLNAQAFALEIEFDIADLHVRAPLRSSNAPVVPREINTK
jgi:hypothetical protein